MQQLLHTSLPAVLGSPGGVEELVLDGPDGVRDPVAGAYTVVV